MSSSMRQRKGGEVSGATVSAPASGEVLPSPDEVKKMMKTKYVGQKGSAAIQQSIATSYLRWKTLLAAPMLDAGEFFLVLFLLAGVITLIGFGLYKQVDVLTKLTADAINKSKGA